MPFSIVRQDITKMQVDAIVNAANTDLAMGGGVCGAIFDAAGPAKLQRACDSLSPIQTGQAVITPGFALPCKFIVHAAGPVYYQYTPAESARLLRSAYTEALRLAAANDCASIAFPLISSGIYGYPKAEALQVATTAITDFLQESDMEVFLAVFDADAFLVSEALMGNVESYIDSHYVANHTSPRRLSERLLNSNRSEGSPYSPFFSTREKFSKPAPQDESEQDFKCFSVAAPLAAPCQDESGLGASLEDMVGNLDEPFSSTLLHLVDAKGKTDVEVYKRANLSRKLFSKIRTGKGYMPSKRTVLALAVGLELDLPQTNDLLARAGYALAHSQKLDVIVEYFIVNHQYDIFQINEVLFRYDQPLLGG